MHEFKNDDDLCAVEASKGRAHATDGLEHIEKLTMLQIIHQDVQVATVLSHALHLAEESMIHLRHVLDLVEEMLLLLSLQHFMLRDDLDSEDLLAVLGRLDGGLPLVSRYVVLKTRWFAARGGSLVTFVPLGLHHRLLFWFRAELTFLLSLSRLVVFAHHAVFLGTGSSARAYRALAAELSLYEFASSH